MPLRRFLATPHRRLGPVTRYGIALVAVLLAVATRQPLSVEHASIAPFIPLFPAVLVAAIRRIPDLADIIVLGTGDRKDGDFGADDYFSVSDFDKVYLKRKLGVLLPTRSRKGGLMRGERRWPRIGLNVIGRIQATCAGVTDNIPERVEGTAVIENISPGGAFLTGIHFDRDIPLADAVTVVVAGAVNVAPFKGEVTVTVGATSLPLSRAARYAFSRPPDATTPDQAESGSTLFMSSVLTPAGVRLGFKPPTSAATPATCGVAMLVPRFQP